MAFERTRARIAEFLTGGMTLPLIRLDGSESTRIDSAGALYSIAFMSCLQVKMRTIGSLPVHVYQKSEKGRIQSDHPLSRIISRRWNPLMTAADGWHWLLQRKDIFGDAYVRVAYDKYENPVAFYPINSPVEVKFDTQTHEAFYKITSTEDKLNPAGSYPARKILHFKTAFSSDDFVYGKSIAELAARAVGLTIDLEKFYRAMLENGSHFPGYFMTEQALNEKDLDLLRGSVDSKKGVKNAGEARIFQKGIQWKQNPVSVGDASLIEQQTWHLQQVCRATGIPPQKVFDLSKSTYSNTEQGQLDFVQSYVTQEVSELEQVIQVVLDEMGDTDHFVKFELNGMLRGSYKDRMEGYSVGTYAGFFVRNEIRGWEDLPALEGLDAPLIPQAYGVVNPDGSITQANTKASKYTLEPVLDDAQKRIQMRVQRDGVSEATRDFATKVLLPIANAHMVARIPFDLKETAERMISNA